MPASSGSHQGTDRSERHHLPDTTEGRHTPSDGEKKGLQAQITAEIAAEVEHLIGEGSLDGFDFEAVETAARQMALRVAGQAVAQRLNADHSDEQGPRLSCGCGAEARYAGRRPRTITTALGPMTIERAWYHCERCGPINQYSRRSVVVAFPFNASRFQADLGASRLEPAAHNREEESARLNERPDPRPLP